MAFLLFLGVLAGIVVISLATNRATGTKAAWLETLALEPGEKEIWRDEKADFGTLPRLGRALVTSYARLHRHTVVWTTRRVVVSQKPLFSSKRMITHQIFFVLGGDALGAQAQKAAGENFGGFYGRGFETIAAKAKSFEKVRDKPCVRIMPTEESAAALNIAEAYVFTDRLRQLQAALALDG